MFDHPTSLPPSYRSRLNNPVHYATIPIRISNTLNMPVATTQIRRERVAKPLKGTSSQSTTFESPAKAKPSRSLQQITAEETSEWQAELNDPSMRQYMFDSPEDPFEYPFKVGANRHDFFTMFKCDLASTRMQTLFGYALRKASG